MTENKATQSEEDVDQPSLLDSLECIESWEADASALEARGDTRGAAQTRRVVEAKRALLAAKTPAEKAEASEAHQVALEAVFGPPIIPPLVVVDDEGFDRTKALEGLLEGVREITSWFEPNEEGHIRADDLSGECLERIEDFMLRLGPLASRYRRRLVAELARRDAEERQRLI